MLPLCEVSRKFSLSFITKARKMESKLLVKHITEQ